jgi:hypothetical protein
MHNLGNACDYQRVDANLVGRRCRLQNWHPRRALVQCSSAIEPVPPKLQIPGIGLRLFCFADADGGP